MFNVQPVWQPVLKLLKGKNPRTPASQRMAPPVEGVSPLTSIIGENALRGKDIIGIAELTTPEILLILDTAMLLKANKFDETQTLFAKGQTLVMLFEKPSLRTRVTFEAGMTQLGGHAIYMEGTLDVREPIKDVGMNLERWVDSIMARTFSHETIIKLAASSNIPVINGLSDKEHPCQALADFQTIMEHKGKINGVNIAFIGDGNNVANSLLLLASKVGANFCIACPKGYEPSEEIWNLALEACKISGAKISITNDPIEAAVAADVVYTDVWISMGEEEQTEEKSKDFAGFMVTPEIMSYAKPDSIFMHCLPAHRGYEVDCAVIDGPQSVVFDQAENRLHAQKALLSLIL